ncbi:DNA-binding protein [Candidatus Woesearchaeota archaeon]|nr:DNA-binding protein [Candidatus Woesearchaeota archaeon]
MEIKDLKPRQSKVEIEVDVEEKGEVREFDKFGAKGRVATAIGKDSTGKIKVTLWNDEIDKVNVGDKIKITNGYVNEFQGEKQLTAGRFGKLEVVSKGKSPSTKKEEDNVEEDLGEDDS